MAGDWTLETLKELFEVRLTALEKELATAITTAREAVLTANVAQEKRLDSLNELREMAEANTRLYMPRLETEQIIAAMNARLNELATTAEERRGARSGLGTGWAAAVAVVGVVSLVVGLFLTLRK